MLCSKTTSRITSPFTGWPLLTLKPPLLSTIFPTFVQLHARASPARDVVEELFEADIQTSVDHSCRCGDPSPVSASLHSGVAIWRWGLNIERLNVHRSAVVEFFEARLPVATRIKHVTQDRPSTKNLPCHRHPTGRFYFLQ